MGGILKLNKEFLERIPAKGHVVIHKVIGHQKDQKEYIIPCSDTINFIL